MFEISKNYDLLGEQLAESGLEMDIDFGAGLGIVSGVASIFGGISGSNDAKAANRRAEEAAEEARELAQEQADINNKYNKEKFEADKKDYFAQRKFNWESTLRQYEYDTSIQDFTYLANVRKYGASVDTYKKTLQSNNLAAQSAYNSQQAQFNELMQTQAFAKQDAMVNRIAAQGQAALRQAGRGNIKAQQATIAAQGRDLGVLRAELRSGEQNLEREFRDISYQKYAADINAKSNLMLRPERGPELLKPVQGPERTFVEPAEVLPAATPPAQYQSTTAPIFGGFSNALGTLAGINWNPTPAGSK